MTSLLINLMVSAVVFLATLVPVIVCDYQLEVNLISYNNPVKRLQDGRCCDARTSDAGAPCSDQDTCDVRFTFSVENINTMMTFSDQDKIVGTYENSDMIAFDNCSTLMNGVRNPLTFFIPSSQWNSGEILRILTGITDVDPTLLSSSDELIMTSRPILAIARPSAPSSVYVNQPTFFGPNSLSLTFQYRVICTAGTCGSTCSQTTNCPPFPSCVPITCADSPCLNGGTCLLVQGCSFSCSCRDGFTGATCGIIALSVSTSDDVSTNTAQGTQTIITSSSRDTSENVQTCEITAAVVSSVTIFIFSSVIFFIVGYLIGYFVHKRKFIPKSASTVDKPRAQLHDPPAQPSFPAPEYAPIHAKATVEQQQAQGFGMKKNEAYAPTSVNATERLDQDQAVEHAYCPVQVNEYVHVF